MKIYIENNNIFHQLYSIRWLVLKKGQFLTFIVVISKERKKIYLPLKRIRVIQTLTFRNILNDLASISLITFSLGSDDTKTLSVKTSEPYNIRYGGNCRMQPSTEPHMLLLYAVIDFKYGPCVLFQQQKTSTTRNYKYNICFIFLAISLNALPCPCKIIFLKCLFLSVYI